MRTSHGHSPLESVTVEAVDKVLSDYMLLGLADIIVCGGGSFCSLAALHGDRPMLSYPSRPPANLPLCLQNARLSGPARHVASDGSQCRRNCGFHRQNVKVTQFACWAGPAAAPSWRTQLSLSWGDQREFDEVIRAVAKVSLNAIE